MTPPKTDFLKTSTGEVTYSQPAQEATISLSEYLAGKIYFSVLFYFNKYTL